MKHTEFDLGQLAGLREWQQDEGDNSERLRRLRRRLPDAMADLTPRQRQMVRLRDGERRASAGIALRLGGNNAHGSRRPPRARAQLYRRLRFAL